MPNKSYSKRPIVIGIICGIIAATVITLIRTPFLRLWSIFINFVRSLDFNFIVSSPLLNFFVPLFALMVGLVKTIFDGKKWKERTKGQKWAQCLLISGMVFGFLFTEGIIYKNYRDSIESKKRDEVLSRHPELSLEIRDIKRINPDTLSLTFNLLNQGYKNAEKVQIRFYLPDSLLPKLYIPGEANTNQIVTFQSTKGVTGLKYALEDQTIYSSSSKGGPYSVKLSIVLVFKVPGGSESSINNYQVYYTIDYDAGSTFNDLYFNIPSLPPFNFKSTTGGSNF